MGAYGDHRDLGRLGRFYDHVRPPRGPNPRIEYGFRVPAIIISPYARAGYVDHTPLTFFSILAFTERIFGLPAMGATDAKANELFSSFDFQQKPLSPLVLQTRSCPPLNRPPYRPLKTYAIAAVGIGAMGTALLVLTFIPLAEGRPGIRRWIRLHSPRLQLVLATLLLIAGAAFGVYVLHTWHLPL